MIDHFYKFVTHKSNPSLIRIECRCKTKSPWFSQRGEGWDELIKWANAHRLEGQDDVAA